jgi:hypothetical protein
VKDGSFQRLTIFHQNVYRNFRTYSSIDVLGLLGQEIANLAESVLLEVAKETVASPHAS